MKRSVFTSLLLAAFTLPACTTIHRVVGDELHYPGGVASEIADTHYIVSARDSKELQLYRYALALALFSRAATANIQNGKEADAFIIGMQDSVDEIDYSAGHLYLADQPSPDCVKKGGTKDECTEHRENFESDIPLVENKLVNVGFNALPKEQAVALYSAARRMDPLATGRAFVKLAFHSLLTFHRAAAVHRTNMELLGKVMGEPKDPNGTVLTSYCFLLASKTGAKPDPLCAGTVFPGPPPINPTITMVDFQPIAAIIQTSCLLLPVNAEADKDTNPAAIRRKACAALKFTAKRRLDILNGEATTDQTTATDDGTPVPPPADTAPNPN